MANKQQPTTRTIDLVTRSIIPHLPWWGVVVVVVNLLPDRARALRALSKRERERERDTGAVVLGGPNERGKGAPSVGGEIRGKVAQGRGRGRGRGAFK